MISIDLFSNAATLVHSQDIDLVEYTEAALESWLPDDRPWRTLEEWALHELYSVSIEQIRASSDVEEIEEEG